MKRKDDESGPRGSQGCPEYRDVIVKYVDGTADEEETARLEAHLEQCSDCRREVAAHTRIAGAARDIRFVDLPQDAWRNYWQNTYNRMERTVGWVLAIIGFVVAGLCAVARFTHWIVTTPVLGVAEKISLASATAGLVVVVAGVVRERIALRRYDRYWRIKQ